MEHQPFENWILSGEILDKTCSEELEKHLAVCQHCQNVQAGIKGAEILFNASEFKSPMPGFANRFKTMAALREEEARRTQSYFFLGYIMAVTVLISIGYITVLMLTRSPADVLSKIMVNTLDAVFKLDGLLITLQSWYRVIPWPLILIIAAGSAGLLVLMTGGWVISVWKLASYGVKINE